MIAGRMKLHASGRSAILQRIPRCPASRLNRKLSDSSSVAPMTRKTPRGRRRVIAQLQFDTPPARSRVSVAAGLATGHGRAAVEQRSPCACRPRRRRRRTGAITDVEVDGSSAWTPLMLRCLGRRLKVLKPVQARIASSKTFLSTECNFIKSCARFSGPP
jgi:hypothetical protein